MNHQVFWTKDTSPDRRVTAETYSGQFRRTGIRITLKSGPTGNWSVVNLTKEEFDEVVTAYLRHVARDDIFVDA